MEIKQNVSLYAHREFSGVKLQIAALGNTITIRVTPEEAQRFADSILEIVKTHDPAMPISDAAEKLGVSNSAIRSAIASGRLQAYRIGNPHAGPSMVLGVKVSAARKAFAL